MNLPDDFEHAHSVNIIIAFWSPSFHLEIERGVNSVTLKLKHQQQKKEVIEQVHNFFLNYWTD